MAKYSVNNHSVENITSWINSGEIAIPEMQRPFVWEASKVRDLMDSLYKGYPVGYIIIWKNPDVKLKDGTFSNGKKIVIDGQQRITALTAAITGQEVVNQEYKKIPIKISFNPLDEKFGRAWMIPKDAEKPVDGRMKTRNKQEENHGI